MEEALKMKEDRGGEGTAGDREGESCCSQGGKIGIAKMVWKKGYQMGVDLFS